MLDQVQIFSNTKELGTRLFIGYKKVIELASHCNDTLLKNEFVAQAPT